MDKKILERIVRNKLEEGLSPNEIKQIPIVKKNLTDREFEILTNTLSDKFPKNKKIKIAKARTRTTHPKKIISVRLPVPLYNCLKQLSTYLEKNNSKLICFALHDYLKKEFRDEGLDWNKYYQINPS